jgi:hypothetical protein
MLLKKEVINRIKSVQTSKVIQEEIEARRAPISKVRATILKASKSLVMRRQFVQQLI